MDVLQLVTTEAPFFEKQVEVLEERGVTCTTLSIPKGDNPKRSIASYGAFYRQVLGSVRDDFDLVHANYGLVGPFALAQPRRPVVLTLWGSEVMGAAQWLDAVSGWAARRADAVVVPTQSVAENVDCAHHLVPFGVDTELFRPIPRAEARQRLGWDADETVVLFPYPPSRTIKNYPLAERVVSQLPTDATLKTMSNVPYEEVPLHMNASDAVLVTSSRESGPMVVKEAAACDVPVVATDVGFTNRVLDDVEDSFVCETEAELVDALGEALRAGRSDGREHVESAGLDRMGEGLLDVYRSVVDDPSEVPDA